MAKVVLAALRKRRGYSYAELSAACRTYPGGQTMGTTLVCSYLQGQRAVPARHFAILCSVLRVNRDEVLTSTYLAGGRQEPVPRRPEAA